MIASECEIITYIQPCQKLGTNTNVRSQLVYSSNLLETTFIKTSSPTIASWNESFCERNADKQSTCPV